MKKTLEMPVSDFPKKIKWLIEDIKKYDPEKVIIFGSAITKNTDEYSDIDAVIIKKTEDKFLERQVNAGRFIRNEVEPIDIFVYTPEEWERHKQYNTVFYEQVMKTGKVVYEKSGK